MKNKDKNNKKLLGGKVLASGGFGCVFSPALLCEGETKRPKNKISKLMTAKYATSEYKEIILIKKKLSAIKNYKDYYLIYDATLCRPSALNKSDLTKYNKCSALSKINVTKKNINNNLNSLLSLNIPNGGLPVDDYMYANGSFEKLYNLHINLVKLLKNGIIPMNNENIYHCDIKDSNIVVDDNSNELKTRLIDWGLATEFIPFKNNPLPKSWKNRPLQFNVPFSVIIFTNSFVEKYSKFIADGGIVEELHLKPFIIDYVIFWMKERGRGHYKLINKIIYTLFNNNLTSISTIDKGDVIETQFTMNYIVNYIVDVLVHFTKFREDGTLNLRPYLDNVFIKITDVWGFISSYYPIVELLSDNYDKLNKNELNVLNKLQQIFAEYLYNPRHEPIHMDQLHADLKDLGDLMRLNIHGKINHMPNSRTFSIKPSTKVHTKTKKKTHYSKKSNSKSKSAVSFKRKYKEPTIQKLFFLSLK